MSAGQSTPKRGRGRPKGLARPRILDDVKLRRAVLAVIRKGGSRADAARKLRFGYTTLLTYEKSSPEFAADMEQAEVDCKLSLIATVLRAAKKDWKAAIQLLARKWPQEWAEKKPDAVSPELFTSVIGRIVSAMLAKVPAEFHGTVRAELDVILSSVVVSRGQ